MFEFILNRYYLFINLNSIRYASYFHLIDLVWMYYFYLFIYSFIYLLNINFQDQFVHIRFTF
jgi:hypothetical protein